MATLTISYSIFAFEEETDLRECEMCEEPIYTKMYGIMVQIDSADRLLFSELDYRFCQSCNPTNTII